MRKILVLFFKYFFIKKRIKYIHKKKIENFDQKDLNDEDVFLLDTYTQVFVWIGTNASADEKKKID